MCNPLSILPFVLRISIGGDVSPFPQVSTLLHMLINCVYSITTKIRNANHNEPAGDPVA